MRKKKHHQLSSIGVSEHHTGIDREIKILDCNICDLQTDKEAGERHHRRGVQVTVRKTPEGHPPVPRVLITSLDSVQPR